MKTDVPFPKGIEPFDGETMRWRQGASRVQHSRRAVGGWLHLTSHRVLFMPHAVDATLNGLAWWAPVDAITNVEIAPRNWDHYKSGGMRRRLRIQTEGGSDDLFVINKLNDIVAALRQAGGLA